MAIAVAGKQEHQLDWSALPAAPDVSWPSPARGRSLHRLLTVAQLAPARIRYNLLEPAQRPALRATSGRPRPACSARPAQPRPAAGATDPPAVTARRLGNGPLLLVIENSDTFDTLAGLLADQPGRVGWIAWGRAGFEASVLSIAEGRRLWRFPRRPSDLSSWRDGGRGVLSSPVIVVGHGVRKGSSTRTPA